VVKYFDIGDGYFNINNQDDIILAEEQLYARAKAAD
jgi:hypothetical protein